MLLGGYILTELIHKSPINNNSSYKWKAFAAIAISASTQVLMMSMVFVALSAIAEYYAITLRAVAWVVIAQNLAISALMMPMGRMADIIGWKKVHLIGLTISAVGCVITAMAPSFEIMLFARVFMAIGISMSTAVGSAMVVAVFPSEERGKAIGSHSTAVAIGGASGPIFAGIVLNIFSWQALFWIIIIPIVIAFIAGYFILDDRKLNQFRTDEKIPFDFIGALLSGTTIVILALTINNPLNVSWFSPLIIGGSALVFLLFYCFVVWELKTSHPMFNLQMFNSGTFSKATLARFSGFMSTTTFRLLVPIYLISLRGLNEGTAGSLIFLTSIGMAISAQTSGRLTDRFGSRPFTILGFSILIISSIGMLFINESTSLLTIAILLLIQGLSHGTWGVPNNSQIMGSVPTSVLGSVGAFSNLTRNVGNVTGQALASALVVAVMATQGFDIPLSELQSTLGASKAFLDGWRLACIAAILLSIVSLIVSTVTQPNFEKTNNREPQPSAKT